jgi:hypothetical protein
LTDVDAIVGAHGTELTHMLLIPPHGGDPTGAAPAVPIVELMPYKLDTQTFRWMAAAAGHAHTVVPVPTRDRVVVREDLMPNEEATRWRGMNEEQRAVELDTCKELVRWSVLCMCVRMQHDFYVDVDAVVRALGRRDAP